jgi:hypothetical protein
MIYQMELYRQSKSQYKLLKLYKLSQTPNQHRKTRNLGHRLLKTVVTRSEPQERQSLQASLKNKVRWSSNLTLIK